MRFNKIISAFMVGALVVGLVHFSASAEPVESISTVESIEIINSEKPSTPSNIKSSIDGSSLKLTWDDNDNADSYIIKYSMDKEIWTTKTSDTNSITLKNLKSGTYYYKIAAKNDSGTGTYSKIISIKVGEDKLPAPTNVQSTSTSTTIKITWDNMDDATSYYVKYSADREEWTTKKTSSNTITLKSLTPSTKYYYQVAAVADKKVGEYSKLTTRSTKEESKAKLNKTSISVAVGKSETLKVSGNIGKVTWSSSDKSVATVSSKGTVKGVKAGTCTITAKVDGKSLKCKVTVNKTSSSKVKYYANTNIPDFGAITGAKLNSKDEYDSSYSYTYYSYSFNSDDLDKYGDVLVNEGFYPYHLDESDDYVSVDFQSNSGWVSIMAWRDGLLITILCSKSNNL